MRAALLVVAVAFGIARGDAPIGAVAVLDKPVAIVGDAVLWQSRVDERMTGREAKDRPQLIEDMIDELIWLRAAKQASITVEPGEVLAALDEIKQQNKLDDAGLDAALKQQGYTRDRYLVDLGNQLIILRARNQLVLMHIVVEDSEIDAHAKANGKTLPLSASDRDDLRRDMRRERGDTAAAKWHAEQKRRSHIERRR
ncbi:MAG: SurA N-terminal domain-containing protein [Kofleriaceae bacterium]